jgi:hypothetical protein
MTATANEQARTVREHPQRVALANEVHARPFLSLAAPERASHLAMTSGESGAAADRAHLTALCERYGIGHPPPGANHFVAELDGFRVKWERHTEFCTWTLFDRSAFRPSCIVAVNRLVIEQNRDFYNATSMPLFLDHSATRLGIVNAPHVHFLHSCATRRFARDCGFSIYQGYTVPPHYDSMVGKLIIHRQNRKQTIEVAKRALQELTLEGITTTAGLFLRILEHSDFCAGEVDTGFIDRYFAPR